MNLKLSLQTVNIQLKLSNEMAPQENNFILH